MDLAKLSSSRYSTLLPYQIPQVRKILFAIMPTARRILDGTVHIGGDALNFAEMYPEAALTVLDNDERAITQLHKNLETYSDPRRFEVRCQCSVEYLEDLAFERKKVLASGDSRGAPGATPHFDLIYLDPPWGGPSYCDEKVIFLFLSRRPIVEVVNLILEANLASHIILKIPRNFAYPDFKDRVLGKTRLYYIQKPQKRGAVAYGLVHINWGGLHPPQTPPLATGEEGSLC